MNINYNARIEQLQTFDGVDVVAIVPGSNMVYFTGLDYHLSERPIIALVNSDGLSLIVPRLEVPTIQKRPDLEARLFMWDDADGYEGAFREAVEALGLDGKTIGVDGLTMRITEWLAFLKVDPSIKVKPVERDLIGIRARKTAEEVALMRQAIAISETALETLISEVRPGMTERQIAARLEALMLAGGAEGLSFGTLVQTGANSDNPHGTTTDRAIHAGEFLLIDYGCKVGGYPSDITRTFVMGAPTDEMRRIYETVYAANAAGKAAAQPGVTMGAVDAATRAVIEAAGYGDYFTHRTGHGLGLDVHEPIPQIAPRVEDVLEAGMVFTIEPGIYIPGMGGVRIEDNVLVTADGLDVLTSFPRELRTL
mgnify:CR=1 FL=1